MSAKKLRRTRRASELVSLHLKEPKDIESNNIRSRFGTALLLAIVGLGAVVGAVASWRGNLSKAVGGQGSSSMAVLLPTPPSMPANAPAKEYVYAGSALISTVEPFRQPSMDLATWRPVDGTWHIMNASGQEVVQQWGMSGDIVAPGDYDGDGKTDCAVFRPSDNGWYILNSSDGLLQNVTLGASGDAIVTADFDGDGKSDPAVWRPSTQTWYILQTSNGTTAQTTFGQSGDKPVPADYDGDGRSDMAVWRDSNHSFYVLQTSNGQTVTYSIGQSGDVPATGDYDGDGKSDYAVQRGTAWFIHQSSDGAVSTFTFGGSRDKTVNGRYNDSADTDSKTDIATWRAFGGRGQDGLPATWYIRRSSDGTTRTVQFGQDGDIPVPAAWKR